MRSLSPCMLVSVAAACASAQPLGRHVYAANNGNLEGSITAFRVLDDGSVQFMQEYVIGTKEPGADPVPGTNAYAIDMQPSGRFLANTHATGLTTFEQIDIWRVNADGTLTYAGAFQTPDSPLDCVWVRDDLLAVTRTQTVGPNHVIMYHFDEHAISLTEIDREVSGGFNAYVEAHPSGNFVYTGESTTGAVRVFSVDLDGEMTLIQTMPTGNYAIDPVVSNDGSKLYAAGGISAGGHSIAGFHVLPDGTLVPMDSSPFFTPGSSPKDFVFSPDDTMLYVSHGSDATCRSFFIDPVSGSLTETGAVFDVGLQGTLGDAAVLQGLLFLIDDDDVIDNVEGLYSFDLLPSGDFSAQHGPPVETQGTWPEHIVAWEPARCRADLSGSSDPNDPGYGVSDGVLDGADFFYFLDQFSAGNVAKADLSGSTDPNDPGYGVPDGLLDAADFFTFLDLFSSGCP